MAITESDKPRFTAEQFYAIIPEENTHAELINGEIVMLAGASTRHQQIVLKISSRLDQHITANKGNCMVFTSPYDVELDDKNVFQPDILVICDPSKIGEKRAYGAPDLVIEVLSESNLKRDLTVKHAAYFTAGVREYWIVDPFKDRTIVYRFDDPADISFYPFDKPVPVGIWDGALEVTIAELIGW